MNKKLMRAIVIAVLGLTLVVGLTGCMSLPDEGTDDAAANRQYMSQVSQVTDELDEKLSGFGEAIANDDLVTMKIQADDAATTIERFTSIEEVPEQLKEIHEMYSDGFNGLQEALSEYITLYTEVANDPEFDYTEFDSRVADIQSTYDEGISQLEKADETAASLNNDEDEE